MHAIRLERDIDLPRTIVWEALVDPVLVGGWLHPTAALVTGTSPLRFQEPEDPLEPALLHVSSPVFGELRVQLIARRGGTRGEWTSLVLEVVGEWGRRVDRERLWELRLDQLEELLRGHPVDWREWAHEHHEEHATAGLEAGIEAGRDDVR